MEKLISVSGLYYQIPHTGSILEDIHFEQSPGEFVALLGHNGAGKSTLIELILGLRTVSQGSISVLGEDPNGDRRAQKHRVSFIGHDIALKTNLSIEEFLNFHAIFYPEFDGQQAKRLLQEFELKPDLRLAGLSTGQQKKVQFVAAAATAPKLLVLDEVTAVFDPASREQFFRQLHLLRERHGTGILLATNIAEDLARFSDRVFFIRQKRGEFHPAKDILALYQREAA